MPERSKGSRLGRDTKVPGFDFLSGHSFTNRDGVFLHSKV